MLTDIILERTDGSHVEMAFSERVAGEVVDGPVDDGVVGGGAEDETRDVGDEGVVGVGHGDGVAGAGNGVDVSDASKFITVSETARRG